eukprot:170106-Chlamydomonas_euryale.AAC.1
MCPDGPRAPPIQPPRPLPVRRQQRPHLDCRRCRSSTGTATAASPLTSWRGRWPAAAALRAPQRMAAQNGQSRHSSSKDTLMQLRCSSSSSRGSSSRGSSSRGRFWAMARPSRPNLRRC